MIQPLRPYQARAVEAVRAEWSAGRLSVCLVAPTGSGKTRLGEELLACDEPCVWVAHRRELITQTVARLRARFGYSAVGAIMPGVYSTPGARIQVGTVQTMLARGKRPPARRAVFDECHHYAAEDWRCLVEAYGDTLRVGLTATPERGDGEPLGDVFGGLVVAANYSELIADGFLVPVCVYRPAESLGNDLAQDPVDAWHACSGGSSAFVFCARVAIAERVAQDFRNVGVRAACIHERTPRREREESLALFAHGIVRVLTNVNTLTEGVDVPEARTCILARSFGHVGGYLQAAGRVLRAAPGKESAVVVDLTGATIRHGLPTTDRAYSLSGRAISGGAAFGGGGQAPEFSQSVRGVELVQVSGSPMPTAAIEREANKVDARAERERLATIVASMGLRPAVADILFAQRFGGSR